jgi:multidrug efflux pump
MQKRFTDVFVKRPVFSASLSLIILLIGLVALKNMDVRQYPKITASKVTIVTNYNGAPPDIIEGFITTPIEQAVSAADGIDYMTSQSIQGQSTITINMLLGFDVNSAMTDIANKVSSVGGLPKDLNNPPVITKSDISSSPFLMFNVDDPNMNAEQITDYIIRVIQPQIQMVDGVSTAQVMGAREYAMRIWLNPYLMTSHDVTAVDVFNAIRTYNVITPSGTVKSTNQQINVYSPTDIKTADVFNNILLKNKNGKLVQLKDVGQAVLGAQNTDFSVSVNDKASTLIQVTQKADANPLTLAVSVKKLVAKISGSLPSGMKISTFYDSTKFIIASINEVKKTLIESCIFVFLVIFLMLGSFRAVFVPLVTIPLSLLGACIIMSALHFSINTLTLLSFVLAIGLVVDDAIVVLENVHRHLEEGLTPKQASLVGAREIAFAVIAMTITLAAVYAPIGFTSGLVGQLFTEFAFTLAGAVIVSGFIALTLSPMMCSKLYRPGMNLHAGLAGFSDKFFEKLRDGYRNTLKGVIKFRFVIAIIALIIYVSVYFLFGGLQKELAPEEDPANIFVIANGPASTNLPYTEGQTQQLAQVYKNLIPEKENYVIVNGYNMLTGSPAVNAALSVINLTDWDQRKRTAMQIRDSLMFPIWAIPGIQAFPVIMPSLPGASGFTPISLALNTTGTYQDLEASVKKFVAEAQQWGGVTNITYDLKIDQPQINAVIDRNKAADLGISMSDISTTLSTFLAKPIVNYFDINGLSYQVIPRLYLNYRDLPTALNNLNVRTKTGQLIPLSNIVTLKEEVIPESNNHFQQLRSATINANLAPGVTTGTALEHLTQMAHTTLPKSIQVDYAGASRQYIKTSGTTTALFLFALIFIYLILAAQFESFRDPLVVMLTVPLAIAGALIGLYICHGTINIYTEIGLVTLIGLITKNGILIVEFANQQQERGMAFLDSIIEGASTRLRPIVMTSAAMILGAIPLMFASGAGAVSRTQMGYVIVFGMTIGTFFTLFVIPVAYYLIAAKKPTIAEEEAMEDEMEPTEKPRPLA